MFLQNIKYHLKCLFLMALVYKVHVFFILVKYAESSTDGSDNEPLSTLMRKKAQAPKGQTTSPNSKKTKPTDKSPKGMLHFY